MELAHTHDHLSNRARVRAALDRKPIFKGVLENPFQLTWPSVSANVQNAVLAHLVVALENVPLRTHPRKPPQESDFTGRHQNTDPGQALDQVSSHLVVGINAVTRALESQLHASRKRVVVDSHQLPAPRAPLPIEVVLVCCADVDPPALIAHVPHLVAGCNAPKNVAHPIRLIPLPKGAESTISKILGVRRAAILAFRDGSPLCETVRDFADSIPILRAPWLCSSETQGPQFVPTHIKQLRTTAPKDMRTAKEQRSKARAAAKRNTAKSRSVHRKPRVTLTTESAT